MTMMLRMSLTALVLATAVACTRGQSKESPGPVGEAPTQPENGTGPGPGSAPTPPVVSGDNSTAVTGLEGLGGPKTTVATIDGTPITEGELATETKDPMRTAQNEYLEKVWQVRAGTLEAMINKRLVQKKAEAEKL